MGLKFLKEDTSQLGVAPRRFDAEPECDSGRAAGTGSSGIRLRVTAFRF
jgi:hypothetical protein